MYDLFLNDRHESARLERRPLPPIRSIEIPLHPIATFRTVRLAERPPRPPPFHRPQAPYDFCHYLGGWFPTCQLVNQLNDGRRPPAPLPFHDPPPGRHHIATAGDGFQRERIRAVNPTSTGPDIFPSLPRTPPRYAFATFGDVSERISSRPVDPTSTAPDILRSSKPWPMLYETKRHIPDDRLSVLSFHLSRPHFRIPLPTGSVRHPDLPLQQASIPLKYHTIHPHVRRRYPLPFGQAKVDATLDLPLQQTAIPL
ncbi:hypothetical protein M407DRAFT_30507 [Tulasnella calospora MUT 4182]|uniref:Uncharacterized protein n=1 Tax=Tulasnella calospora MUT 4182 TaxID=1051891 RepID=A0A0C3LEK4_9AGAM|nr:hypothetical protein M407DRAFT_30507 [Tulasnella calospora MUT 4182]